MKFSPLHLCFFLGGLLAVALPAAAQKTPAPSLRFDRMPLDHVVRVLSARFAASVTIAGRPTARISGDFSALDLRQALAETARQAGLVLLPADSGTPAAFRLAPADLAPRPMSEMGPEDRRAALLKKRKDLLDQAALLEH